MANERFGLRCPVCKECLYLAKTMGGGLYRNSGGDFSLEKLFEWMDDHIFDCHQQGMFWLDDNVPAFEIVAEGHPDVQAMFEKGSHWNKYPPTKEV